MKTFNRLVANTVIASTTNNFLWFALTFWVYLETRSVIASSVIGGSYMLLFGTGSERGMALIFIIAGTIGLVVTILALNSKAYKILSKRYAETEPILTETTS